MRAALARRLRAGGGPDEGRITLLALGFTLVAAALVLVVVAASSVHLERKRLLALADLVALDAADALAADAYYAGGLPDDGLPLSDAGVRAEVDAALDAALVAGPEGAGGAGPVAVLAARTLGGGAVEVRLAAVVAVPFVGGVLAPWTDGVPVQARSVARTS
ncbi:pilus assembly protein TadG-related protein [Cellulomonas endophytica]|uniref:pilus assembly protein TadG-related protein n=1 Tax=Cellulomonas endophytica TaxID=2494735 RepID=UPI0010135633|nr:pilus assembly protein TadG-related protein [Cellulomonas endophytica]